MLFRGINCEQLSFPEAYQFCTRRFKADYWKKYKKYKSISRAFTEFWNTYINRYPPQFKLQSLNTEHNFLNGKKSINTVFPVRNFLLLDRYRK